MACNISKVLENFNNIIDTTIKGNAASITQDSKGDFHVKWGDTFNVKTKNQAFRMAEKKVQTTLTKLEEEGFSQNFGPYLSIDNTLVDEIIIYKIEPKRLVRALELRNQAEEEGKIIDEILSKSDREFFQQQIDDMAILDAQRNEQLEDEDTSQTLINQALSHIDKINSDVYKNMFKSNPEEFLKFLSQQYWASFGIKVSGEFNFTPGTGLDAIPDEIMDIAKQLFPQDTYIKPDGLPGINPEC